MVSKIYQATRTEVKEGNVFIAVELRDRRWSWPACRSRDMIGEGQRNRGWEVAFCQFRPSRRKPL
ncbi:hypothetical protein LBMAG56_22680 [Verrucomicrobiota bacterium]|nr:hypothetical protein LBMAG56_22680 [Verrucomicrobiota bacterium]